MQKILISVPLVDVVDNKLPSLSNDKKDISLSWALILMSGGYGVILELYVNNDYSWLLFVFIPILALIIIIDQFTKRHIETSKNTIFLIGRFLLPVFVVLIISAATFLIYSNCSYFVYLSL